MSSLKTTLLPLLGAACAAPTAPTSPKSAATAPSTKHYQLVLIWMKDQSTFARYVEAMRPIATRHTGQLFRMFLPSALHGEGLTKPDIVNLVFYDSPQSADALEADPEFQRIVHMRSESIDMVSFGGAAEASAPMGDPARRLYLIEIARFGPGAAQAYQAYEAEAEPVMRRYGYHVERRFKPERSHGAPFAPDLIKVAYFEDESGMARMHEAPEHERIERVLYPGAVAESIWIIAKAQR